MHRYVHHDEQGLEVLESNLYDSGSADLMWTATTQTTDPRSAEEALPPLARVLMKTLDRAGFLR